MFIQISHHPPKRQDFRLAKHQMTVKVFDFFYLKMCIHGIISRIHPRFLENVYVNKYNYIDTYTYVYLYILYIYILVCMFFGGRGLTRTQRDPKGSLAKRRVAVPKKPCRIHGWCANGQLRHTE